MKRMRWVSRIVQQREAAFEAAVEDVGAAHEGDVEQIYSTLKRLITDPDGGDFLIVSVGDV